MHFLTFSPKTLNYGYGERALLKIQISALTLRHCLSHDDRHPGWLLHLLLCAPPGSWSLVSLWRWQLKSPFCFDCVFNDDNEVGDVDVKVTKIHMSICFQHLQFSARDARHGLFLIGWLNDPGSWQRWEVYYFISFLISSCEQAWKPQQIFTINVNTWMMLFVFRKNTSTSKLQKGCR